MTRKENPGSSGTGRFRVTAENGEARAREAQMKEEHFKRRRKDFTLAEVRYKSAENEGTR